MASNDARGKSVSGVKTYGSGVGNAASYLVAGTPFIQYDNLSGSAEAAINFPNLAMRVTVENNDTSGNDPKLRVHFAPSGSGVFNNNRYVEIIPGGTWTADVKCSTLHLSTPTQADVIPYGVIAELTGIEAGYQPSGSGVTS